MASTPKDQPTAETGEVGSSDYWDNGNLTVDVGFSSNGYAALGMTTNLPGDLIMIPWSRLGPLIPSNPASGDLVLHVRSNNVLAVEHVLRRVEHSLTGRLTTTWTLTGMQRFAPADQKVGDHGRALIGFHDGLSNLNPDDADDQTLIFVNPAAVSSYPANPSAVPVVGQPGYGAVTDPTTPTFPADLRPPPPAEPGWTAGGSYMFIRASVLNTARWDTQTLGTQETAVGRFKSSGSFLDRTDTSANQRNAPTFATDPTSVTVPPTSHSRRANPRSQASDQQRRVLRRGYPLLVPDATGTLSRGLTLATFSRSLSTQSEFVIAAWLNNPQFPHPGAGTDPLLAFETQILAGGYYFVPPLSDPKDPTTWQLPA